MRKLKWDGKGWLKWGNEDKIRMANNNERIKTRWKRLIEMRKIRFECQIIMKELKWDRKGWFKSGT